MEEIKGLDPVRTELVELVCFDEPFLNDLELRTDFLGMDRLVRGAVISSSSVPMNSYYTKRSSTPAKTNSSAFSLLPFPILFLRRNKHLTSLPFLLP